MAAVSLVIVYDVASLQFSILRLNRATEVVEGKKGLKWIPRVSFTNCANFVASGITCWSRVAVCMDSAGDTADPSLKR